MVLETAGLNATELTSCRERVLFPEQLHHRRQVALRCQRQAGDDDSHTEGAREASRPGPASEQSPQRELQRKEKALAEAVALLVLRKKKGAYSCGETCGYCSEYEEG